MHDLDMIDDSIYRCSFLLLVIAMFFTSVIRAYKWMGQPTTTYLVLYMNPLK